VSRIAVGLALLALAAPKPAVAHEPGAPTRTGFVATVSAIEPNVLGVQARTVRGDQVLVSNLSRDAVLILDAMGRPFIRIPSGKSRAWHDARIVESGPPPSAAAGADESAPRFVKNWTIPGRARGRPFAIHGILGWVPPKQDEDAGPSTVVLAGGALVLVALSAAAAYLLGRRGA
jgi:hypothetical protein